MSRRDAEVRRALDILTEISPRFRDAWRMHQEHRPAAPASAALDRTGSSGSGPSDPTLSAALTGAQTAHDRRRAELDDAIRALTRSVRVIDGFVRANTPRTATEKDRREAERANTPDPECHLMRRHTNTFEPALCESDLGGLLDRALPVSRWVHDFARRSGRLPTRAECQQRARGQRVMIRTQGEPR